MPMSCSLAAMRLAKSFGAVALIVAAPGPAGSHQLPPHAEPWLSVAQASGAGDGRARSGIVLVRDAVASGFPDASTAGVPPGINLEEYTGPMEITEAGTVIENAIINGTLRITADNVVVKNSVIKYSGSWGIDAEGAKNVTIQNNDITGPGYSGTANAAILGSGNFSGNDISKSENGIVLQGGASTVKGNYIHDLEVAGSDPHYDGISVQGGQNGVLIEGNTVIGRDTSDVFIKNDFGPIANVKVIGNLLLGDSGYPVYVDGRANGGPITGVTISNNHVEIGGYGYYSVENASPAISGNIEYPRNGAPMPGR